MANTNPGGAGVPGAWAKQQKEGLQHQDAHAAENAKNEISKNENAGDERTPDKTIGQVAYAQGDDPAERDDITAGDEAQKQREKRMEKAKGDRQ